MYAVRYISESEQKKHSILNINDFVHVIEKMFITMSNGDYVMGGYTGNSHGDRILFDRRMSKGAKNLFISMPGYLGDNFQCAGIKWHGPNVRYSSDTETKYLLVMNDVNTGVPKAIMPANLITTYRTAAVSVFASKLLASGNPKCIGIIGPGKINTVFLDGIKNIFPDIETVKIKGRSQTGIKKAKEKIARMYDQKVTVEIVETFEDAVRDSDIISINTGFEFDSTKDMPLIRSKWIKPGAVLLCSAYIAFSDTFLEKSAVKVADNLKMYQCYEKELGVPTYKVLSYLGNRYVDLIRENRIAEQDILDLADLASGKKRARRSSEDIITVSLGGMAIEDIAIGRYVLDKAEKCNAGILLDW